MKNRIKAPVALVAGTLLLSGCSGLLDVDNPNNLVEEAIQQEAAANGVVNGALWHVSEALGSVWEGPAVTSNELYWIGSRDAWGALDQGFISDNANEFTDAAFPNLGQAAWMAQNAVEILEGHVANSSDPDQFQVDRGRAYMLRGMILMVVAEQQQDMTFSYKQTDGPPVSGGSAVIGSEGFENPVPSMDAVMDLAITSLNTAIGIFQAESEDDLELDATALLMRAEMSEEIMAARNSPCNGTVAGCAINFADAVPHALTVLADGGADYRFNLSFSAASTDCNMCGNVNQRKENQIDLSLVTVDASNDIDGINLVDVVDGTTDDPALIAMLNQWKGGSYLDSGNQYPDLTVSSARLAHLILAESAAAGNGSTGDTFQGHINDLRAIDSYPATYAGGNEVATLVHHRRVNTLLQGLWLQDMYRWGLQPSTTEGTNAASVWSPSSPAFITPGTMLPIMIIEVRANCHLNGNGCGG
jgi:hypothetical protein